MFLTLSESIFGGKIGSTVTHLAGMDTWRDYMVWAIRDKGWVSEVSLNASRLFEFSNLKQLNEEKYFTLALQPANIAPVPVSEKGDKLEISRVRLLWQVGRILASHGMLKETYYGETVGEALKWCLEDTQYPPTQVHFHMAAEMICHLCVPPIDIPFRTENIKKLTQPLSPTDFLAVAPALTNELIRLICLCDTKRADLSVSDIRKCSKITNHNVTCRPLNSKIQFSVIQLNHWLYESQQVVR